MDAMNFTREVPAWLDQSLFDKAIQTFHNDPQAKVSSFSMEPATKLGENCSSAIFRAAIKFSSKYQKDEQEMTVIVKTQPATVDLPMFAHMKDVTLFETEMSMYGKVLNQMEELLKSAGYDDVMCPKLIYQTMSPKPVIMLEDVNTRGFDTSIKTMHGDFEVTKMIIRKLARFHAAGFYLNDNQNINAADFNSTTFRLGDMAKMMMQQSFEVIVEQLSGWDGFEKFIEPLKNVKYVEQMTKSYTPNQGAGAFNVLNHGDFLLKNVLYKMKAESGQVEDFILYDFQICIYASPAIDLSFLLYNFVADEHRVDRYDEILGTYHEQFAEALKKFGYLKQPPSLLDLQIEMMKNGQLLAQNVLFMYPFMTFDMSTLTMEDMADGFKGLQKRMYQNVGIRKVLKKELDIYLAKGYFGN